jgi:hypothetical protein
VAAPPTIVYSSEVEHFNLIRGGWVYRIQAWLKLVIQDPHHVWSRILIGWCITWLPLFVLTGAQGDLIGNGLAIPFLLDYATNIRFLVTLPILLYAQVVIERRTKEAVTHFVESELVSNEELPAFEEVIHRTLRLRDSRVASVILIVISFVPSLLLRGLGAEDVTTASWRNPSAAGHSAAWIYASLVSMPVYRILLFRWIFLMGVWATFLWRATRLPLRCVPSHPDGSAGLGFLGHTQLFFGPVLFAASAVTAGSYANQIAYAGSSVEKLKFAMLGFCFFAIVIAIAPLLVVVPRLFQIKEDGLLDYHTLGVDYTWQFDRKWIHRTQPAKEELLGTGDIQSLADLNNSVAVVREMNIWLLDREVLLGLAIPAVLPMLILLATALPAEKLVETLMHLIG